ncbi:Uncharacterised protein [Niallia circulans]|nr:Uncharacterised protein [Niallia circulans]
MPRKERALIFFILNSSTIAMVAIKLTKVVNHQPPSAIIAKMTAPINKPVTTRVFTCTSPSYTPP